MIDCITQTGFEPLFGFATGPGASTARVRAKSIEHRVSLVTDGPNACNPAIPHSAFDCPSTRPNPQRPGIDATSRSCPGASLTAHDLARRGKTKKKKTRSCGTARVAFPLDPIHAHLHYPRPRSVGTSSNPCSLLTLGYVHVWTFAGAISSPTVV